MPLVYEELRKLAAKKMAQERPGQTLQATALVHEAYLRLAGVWDTTGRVLGLMPHPERHVLPTQHPCWIPLGLASKGDGLRLFRNAVRYFS